MKKLTRFQPSLITERFFAGVPRSKINKGRCFKWAYLTYLVFDKTELWSMGSHAFIKYRDKFYDAERHVGVLDWRDLPATNDGEGCGCVRCSRPAKREYVPSFKHIWRGCQRHFEVKWEHLEADALKMIEKYK